MAAIYKCDGCGKEVGTPMQVGFVLRRDYCPECAKLAQDFLDAEEKMRADICDAFRLGREKMVKTARLLLKELPDVP